MQDPALDCSWCGRVAVKSWASGGLQRLDTLETELRNLRAELAEEKKQRGATRRWLIGIAITAAVGATAIASFILTYILHIR